MVFDEEKEPNLIPQGTVLCLFLFMPLLIKARM